MRRAAYVFGHWNRGRKAGVTLQVAQRDQVRSVLLVGVAGEPNPVNNQIESRLQECFEFVVATGLSSSPTGWDRYVAADGCQLPFSDDAFDMAFANAVIEHVGSEMEQQLLVDELGRVARLWILTTPNRWFPLEAHFHTAFTHWRSGWAPRGTVTRLLGIRDLRALAEGAAIRGLPVLSPTLMAIGRRSAAPRASRSHDA